MYHYTDNHYYVYEDGSIEKTGVGIVNDIPDGIYEKTAGNQYTEVTMTRGYQVAKPSTELWNWQEIRQYRIPAGIVQIWTDPVGGRIYIDECYWIPERYPAEALARHWNQTSVWDWLINTTIDI